MIFLLGSFLWADQLLYEGDLGQAIDDLVLSENEEYKYNLVWKYLLLKQFNFSNS